MDAATLVMTDDLKALSIERNSGLKSDPNSPVPVVYDINKRKMISPQSRYYNFRIEGHRGFGRYEPENTYQAFTRAIDNKLDGIELDVWLTSDQVPVVIHTGSKEESGIITYDDGTRKLVYETTYEELRSRKILNGHKIPTIEEILRLTRGKTCVNIEFKGTDLNGAELVLKAVQEEGMTGQVQFSSFNWKFYDSLKEAAKKLGITEKIPFGFLIEEVAHIESNPFRGEKGDAITLKWDMLVSNRQLILNTIEQAKENGYNVKIFFPFKTPETHEVYTELEELGIETIITNEPQLAKAYFEGGAVRREQESK